MSIRMGTSGSGYTTVRDSDTGEWCYVHRLIAAAVHGTDATRHNDVHHIDGNPWINSPDNLIPLPWREHRADALGVELD